MYYHAVMIDETGCEFGVGVEATCKTMAEAKLREDYPESRVDQLESSDETAARQMEMYARIARGGDWDDEGRPIGGDYDDDDEPEEDDE